ncbi:helix-turn-helix domain-containing protein [Oceanimonas doudoroffii]|uniref:histidine kinase n=1 Tax=Oceanimonas doudoroffii TaxID=84158 RepID=A0A233RDG5_9GAMM|nr:helix-turn-helix transcriptional regulator [Oceanimonas doudoroffii]OXY81426.1 transcriptional regulator [Oceanimonas doudoroffii]
MTSTNEFGKRLLALLKQKKMSQLRLAEALGVSRTAVNKWTKGGMIDEGNLDRLASHLEVDKIWLKYGEYTNVQPEQGQQQADTGQTRVSNITELHLQESAEIVTWEWDLLTDELQYSDNVEAVYGVRLNTNDDFWALMNDEARDKLVNGYSRIIREGGAHEMDFKIERHGQHRWITSRATGVKGPNGKVTKLLGISLDNTERKNNELRLRKMKQYFDVLLAHMDHPVVFTDKAGEILVSNRQGQADSLDYLELQRLLYQLVMNNKAWLERVCETGKGRLQFQGWEVTAHHHLDDDQQSFLMFEFEQEAGRAAK